MEKKIRHTQGTFHAKTGTIKDRNGLDLTEAEDIKKRWPDISEYNVKRVLGIITMNKASEVDGIPGELFQILKDDAMKVLHSICQQIWKTALATGLEKVSFHSNPKERQCQRMVKLRHNCAHLTCQ